MKLKEWPTDKFKIDRGVFQGDTLSPPIFSLPTTNSLPEMPKTNSYIYALWNEPNSDEPIGWYLAEVTSIEDDGSTCLKYHKGNLTKVIKPTELKWHSICGTKKWFQTTQS